MERGRERERERESERKQVDEREKLRRTGSKDRQSGTQTKCQKGWEDRGKIKIERPNRGRKKKKMLNQSEKSASTARQKTHNKK